MVISGTLGLISFGSESSIFIHKKKKIEILLFCYILIIFKTIIPERSLVSHEDGFFGIDYEITTCLVCVSLN